MSRGDRGEDIFLDDVDRQDFIKTLAGACQKTGWRVHAYCLMRNHYHLVLETPNANFVAGMAWLQWKTDNREDGRQAWRPSFRQTTPGSCQDGDRGASAQRTTLSIKALAAR